MEFFSRLILKKLTIKVKWSFLQQVFHMKGFDPKWRDWTKSFVQGGSVGIRVNDEIGHYFQTKKGLRQGGPLLL
jgi:hypothetical protein